MSVQAAISSLARAGRSMAVAALAVLLTGFVSIEALFAPKAELWERWTAQDPAANTAIDHSVWDGFLTAYVNQSDDAVNRVAYARVTGNDRKALDGYLARLAATPISHYARAEQLAYWINLYNALTVQLILDNDPVDSIRDIDISPGLFTDGPWDKPIIQVESVAISLNDIEHRILRPIWRDPRLHYAVNCASVGCPNLQPVAFTAANVESLLEAAARAYVNHPRGARVAGGDLAVSSIYVWFQEDFGDNDAGVIAHLRQYADQDLTESLTGIKRIGSHDYDWKLNGASEAPSS